ncbi:MAG TPA: type II secretion system protein [Candidatus Acidoferrum sp.]|nr:type II secretion system protein [Candidatus Acidoferrum sp.]
MKIKEKADHGPRTADHGPRTTDYGLRTTDHGLRATDYGLRTTDRAQRAFTMIEIAISLAVIGFALVAIIGILPTAMNVQKDNRQETIINQDLSVFMNAIRNGERGLDDLTNSVLAITNYWRAFSPRGAPVGPAHTYGYSFTGSSYDGGPSVPQFPITNGFRIVGLLTTPKILLANANGAYYSNHVVAFVRSMSGGASEKVPQTNSTMQDFALSYKLISEVIPYGTNFFNPAWINIGDPALIPGSAEAVARTNYLRLVNELQRNLYELRLTFRWPILPNGNSGPGRQVFRTTVAGSIDGIFVPPGLTNLFSVGLTNLYFFQPGNFVQAQ